MNVGFAALVAVIVIGAGIAVYSVFEPKPDMSFRVEFKVEVYGDTVVVSEIFFRNARPPFNLVVDFGDNSTPLQFLDIPEGPPPIHYRYAESGTYKITLTVVEIRTNAFAENLKEITIS